MVISYSLYLRSFRFRFWWAPIFVYVLVFDLIYFNPVEMFLTDPLFFYKLINFYPLFVCFGISTFPYSSIFLLFVGPRFSEICFGPLLVSNFYCFIVRLYFFTIFPDNCCWNSVLSVMGFFLLFRIFAQLAASRILFTISSDLKRPVIGRNSSLLCFSCLVANAKSVDLTLTPNVLPKYLVLSSSRMPKTCLASAKAVPSSYVLEDGIP